MNRVGIRVVTLAVCVGSLWRPMTLEAQQAPAPSAPKANTEKLMLSFALGGASIYSEDLEKERESGGGFSAQLG